MFKVKATPPPTLTLTPPCSRVLSAGEMSVVAVPFLKLAHLVTYTFLFT